MSDFLNLLTLAISVVVLIVFMNMASNVKKIYYILDYFYQKDKKKKLD